MNKSLDFSALENKRHVIFDFDETIADTRTHNLNMWLLALREVIQEDFDEEKVTEVSKIHRGLNCTDLAFRMIETIDEKFLLPEIIHRVVDLDAKLNSENIINIKIFEHFKDMLENLKRLGFNVSICTNRDKATVEVVLFNSSILHHFDEIHSAHDLQKVKPDPYSINLILKKFSLDQSEVLYVGDCQTDIDFAMNAGVDYIIVNHYESSEPAPFQLLSKQIIGVRKLL